MLSVLLQPTVSIPDLRNQLSFVEVKNLPIENLLKPIGQSQLQVKMKVPKIKAM
jgi:hypothetical protein